MKKIIIETKNANKVVQSYVHARANGLQNAKFFLCLQNGLWTLTYRK